MLPDMGMVPISNQDIKKQRNEKISIQFSEYELWELLPNIWGSRKISFITPFCCYFYATFYLTSYPILGLLEIFFLLLLYIMIVFEVQWVSFSIPYFQIFLIRYRYDIIQRCDNDTI